MKHIVDLISRVSEIILIDDICKKPCNILGSQSMDNNQQVSVVRGGSLGRGNRGSLVSAGKPSSSTLASLAGLLAAAEASSGKGADQRSSVTETVENTEEKEPVLQRVRVSAARKYFRTHCFQWTDNL